MKKILLLHTGGTISMEEDKTTGEVGQKTGHPLQNLAAGLGIAADIEEKIVYDLPSPQMTPKHMAALTRMIDESANLYDGFVITHGTDTMEETAYFLDITVTTDKPVVLTGAMRSSNELGSDALANLAAALSVSIDPAAKQQGVLVVMNGEIHAARDVSKTSSMSLEAFQSTYGSIGVMVKNKPLFVRSVQKQQTYPIGDLASNVLLIKAYAGMDSMLLKALQQLNPDGIVIEALGQGNLPKAVMPALKNILNASIPVVVVSRCQESIVQPTYTYDGGGKQLQELGAIFTQSINGQKARLQLLVILETARDLAVIQTHFS